MEMAGHHSTGHGGEGDHLLGGGDDYEGGYGVGEGGRRWGLVVRTS